MIFRYVNYLMILLFATSAIAQINDPDPFFWVFIYSAASVISLLYATGKLQVWLAAVLTVFAGTWALTVAPDLTYSGFRYIFDEIQMRAIGVEAAREFSGLIIIAIWAATLAIKTRKQKE